MAKIYFNSSTIKTNSNHIKTINMTQLENHKIKTTVQKTNDLCNMYDKNEKRPKS